MLMTDQHVHHRQHQHHLKNNISLIELKNNIFYAKLRSILIKNEAFTGFCTHPDAVLIMSVAPENKHKINKRQYPIAQALVDAADAVITRWIATGKVVKAPPGCIFNNPILVAPKKDINGNWTKIRVCLDVRELNRWLLEDDRFIIPYIPDVLAAFRGGKIFGEFDLSEAYFQFQWMSHVISATVNSVS